MSKKSAIFGAILIIAGLILIGNTLNFFWFDFEDALGVMAPIALMIIGLWLIVRNKNKTDPRINVSINRPDSCSTSHKYRTPEPPPVTPDPAPSTIAQEQASNASAEDQTGTRFSQAPEQPSHEQPDKLRYSKSLGDMFIHFDNIPLRNVEISMGIGDLEANFSGAILSEGLNRVIISGFIGDIRLFLPKNLPYQIHCSNTIGDVDLAGKFTSGLGNNVNTQSPDYETASSRLYIAVNNFIGDIRVYRV